MCGLRPRIRLRRPVDATEHGLAAAQGAACGAALRMCGLRPRIRLKRPVDATEHGLAAVVRVCPELEVESAPELHPRFEPASAVALEPAPGGRRVHEPALGEGARG